MLNIAGSRPFLGDKQMKKRIISSVVVLFSMSALALSASAQNVDVKDVNAGDGESTTIEIRKGKAVESKDKQWEITEGTSDIEGEPGTMMKEARSNWKQACNDWKKEFRQDNKENKILNINCGSPECGGETGSKICSSKANYKLKTRVN